MADRTLLPRGFSREPAKQVDTKSDLLLLIDNVVDYAIFLLDPQGNVKTWTLGAQRMKGYAAEEIIGQHFSRFYTPEDLASGKPDRELLLAREVGRMEDEGWRVRRDGSRFWASVVITALRGPDGELRGFGKVTRDLTERKRTEELERELMRRKVAREARELADARIREVEKRQREAAQFLADASAAMTESLDYGITLRRIASLVVPRLADWCAVHLWEDGAIRKLTVAHVDPAKVALAEELESKYGPRPDDPGGVAGVLRSGVPELYPQVTDDMLVAGARSEEHLRALRGLGIRSVILAPLKMHETTFGAITLVTAESGRIYSDHDLAVAEELGRRAATAIENARAYREARAAIRVRDEFLAVAGHELKTPLAALQLQLESLVAAFGSNVEARQLPRLAQRLGKTLSQAGRLEGLVSELLDVSRISSGRLVLDAEECDLAEIAEEVIERHAEEVRRSGSSVAFEQKGNTDGVWDRGRLDQVVSNLFANAVKYGTGGPIAVRVDGDDPELVRLSVRDHGIGIAREDQARIFGRFERAVSERNYGGFGLGLWIVRELVAAHGGRVSFESSPGEGSTFLAEIPRKAP
jgi:PAS domain S-box-containing protein